MAKLLHGTGGKGYREGITLVEYRGACVDVTYIDHHTRSDQESARSESQFLDRECCNKVLLVKHVGVSVHGLLLISTTRVVVVYILWQSGFGDLLNLHYGDWDRRRCCFLAHCCGIDESAFGLVVWSMISGSFAALIVVGRGSE